MGNKSGVKNLNSDNNPPLAWLSVAVSALAEAVASPPRAAGPPPPGGKGGRGDADRS